MRLFELLLETAPTADNMDGSYTVGGVKFDNDRGLGSTPIGKNVMYRGAVAFIKPSTFRKLAIESDRSDTATELVQKIQAGVAIATPWLDIDVIGDPSNPDEVKVTGHEGRARTDAFKIINGDVYMPVQLQLIGIRARHLTPEFFKWIEKHGLTAERSSTKIKLAAEKYFWDGQTITV